jgi:hypothetical protein
MKLKKANVNLASRPLRNRRFFFALLSFAGGAFLLVAALAAFIYFNNSDRERAGLRSLARLEEMTRGVQKENNEWNLRVRDLSREEKDKIDSTNAIILKKTFSWIDFFSRLEEALPAASYISAMPPLQAGEGKVAVRFRVVSPSLNDLLALIQKLASLGFEDISVKNEILLAGQISSEILLNYERTF